MNALIQGFADELLGLFKQAAAVRSTLTPDSSNVRGYRYDVGAKQLFVTYRSGGTYRYDEVPGSAVKALARNKSAGKTVNRLVKDKGYAYEKISADVASFLRAHPLHVLELATLPSELMHMLNERDERERAGDPELPVVKPPRPRERHRLPKHASSIHASFAHIRRALVKLAGVAKRQTTVQGLTLKIEHDPGDTRTGKSKDGSTWSREMHASYGYVPGTGGMGDDGEAIDVYLAPDPVDGPVFCVDQQKKDGGHDENKYMVGWASAGAAKKAYLDHMPTWAFGSIREAAKNPAAFAASLKRKTAA